MVFQINGGKYIEKQIGSKIVFISENRYFYEEFYNEKITTMNYTLFGNSGLRVSELCLGTMTFGEEWGWGASREESKKIFEAFSNAGGNFLDTANRYTDGTSEKFVGEFIHSQREYFVLATKYSLSMKHGDPNAHGNHRKNLVQSLDASLKRLNTDYIDVYWLHAWDFLTPVEEVMRALDDQIRAGKILYIGISDTPAWIVARANTLAQMRGWTSFVGLQIEYSLIQRTVESDLLPMAQAFSMAVTPWATLGSGLLSGKFSRQNDKRSATRLKEGSPRFTERNFAIARTVDAIADEIGKSSSQVAINWVRNQKGNIIPLIGARTVEQLNDNLGCLNFELSAEQLQRLDEVSKIELGFPHEFLSSDNIKEIVYGGTLEKIKKSV